MDARPGRFDRAEPQVRSGGGWSRRIQARLLPASAGRRPERALGGTVAVMTLAGLLVAGAPARADAQVVRDEAGRAKWTAPAWVGDATFLGANSLLGGLTAGVGQRLRGGSFRDGFARGALGGGVAYLGRRVAAADLEGAGLLGRSVSAVGASLVRNALDGRPGLERLWFPVGPVDLYVDRSEGAGVSAKLSVYRTYWLATALLTPELEFDARSTLSMGAPVFRAPGLLIETRDMVVQGNARGDVVVVGVVDESLHYRERELLAHETVHVLQLDMLFHTFSDPVESSILGRSTIGSAFHRRVSLGITGGLIGHFLSDRLAYRDHPWEIEAAYLGRR